MCVRCVLTTGDNAEIEFDSNGLCNHCRAYDRQVAALPPTAEEKEHVYRNLVHEIRTSGHGKPYDCILGVSGGVDSSYLAYLCKRDGLRPLVVHFDNGWNSELSVKNIESVVTRLGFDLNTYVINWEEFRQAQLAYLRASVIDIEALTDHAIYGALMRLALRNGIRFVLSGNNIATEGILPYSWTHRKSDYVNIIDIHKKFGAGSLRSFPLLDRKVKRRVKRAGIRIVTLLDYLPYNKTVVKQLLATELGWRDYGGKHYESVFTRFYQSYILPQKFGVDKRKAHLSSLICSGQMTKAEALAELAQPIDDPARIEADKKYVIKKLGLTESEFDEIMRLPIRRHTDFEVEGSFFNHYPLFKPLRGIWKAVRPAVAATGLKKFAVA